MLSFPLFPFLCPDGIRQHLKAVLYERKRMINLGHNYEVCRKILLDNTCIYSKKKQNVSPGKTSSAPTKGFRFVTADLPLKALCFPSKCRALGHETPIPGGLLIWSHTIIVPPYLVCFKLQSRAVKITFCSFQRKSKKVHESESSESASTSAGNDTDILSDDDSSSDTSNGKVRKIFISAFYYIACGQTTCLLLFLVEVRIKALINDVTKGGLTGCFVIYNLSFSTQNRKLGSLEICSSV